MQFMYVQFFSFLKSHNTLIIISFFLISCTFFYIYMFHLYKQSILQIWKYIFFSNYKIEKDIYTLEIQDNYIEKYCLWEEMKNEILFIQSQSCLWTEIEWKKLNHLCEQRWISYIYCLFFLRYIKISEQ